MAHVEGEVLRQFRRLGVGEERPHQTLGLVARDHAATTGRDRHGARASQDLQLHGRALHARDAQGHAPVVDLVVAVILQQRVGDLRQTEAILAVYVQRHDGHAVQHRRADVVVRTLAARPRCIVGFLVCSAVGCGAPRLCQSFECLLL